MNYEIDFEITKNGEKINGVKLSAKGHTESIDFCASFPKALFEDRTANIVFEGNKMIFQHPKCISPGEFSVELNPNVIEEIKDVINPKRTISLERWSAWGGGFRLYVKDVKA